MSTIAIGIVGCAGHMGRMLIRSVLETDGVALAGGTEAPGSPALGQDLGLLAGLSATGTTATGESSDLFARATAVIDFTAPKATRRHADIAAETKTALVIGTTGLLAEDGKAIETAAQRTPVVWAANMSLGVTLLTELVRRVAASLNPDYDIEVVEMHHRRKVDAPSGTALALGRAAAEGRGVDLAAVSQRVRDGQTGPRKRGDIGFAALRGGDVVGDHSVIFAAEGERLELTHKASSREIYARGAVTAARWVAGKPPGLYSMKDVLGLA